MCSCIQLCNEYNYSYQPALRLPALLHVKDCICSGGATQPAAEAAIILLGAALSLPAAEIVGEEDNEFFFFFLNRVTKGK